MLSVEYWGYLLAYAVGVGLVVGFVVRGLKRVAHLETKPSEAGALAGAVIGLIAVLGPQGDPTVVVPVALLAIGGYFAVKFIVRRT